MDVAVVGAGIAGCMAAYECAIRGRTVALLDERGIGAGESGRTTAHVTWALDDRFHRLLKVHGADRARRAARSHQVALQRLQDIVRSERIGCDLEEVDGYLFLHPGTPRAELEREAEACRELGLGVEWVEDGTPQVAEAPALRFPAQAQVHPLKLLGGLARRVEREGGIVHTGVRVRPSGDGILEGGGHAVRAGHVLWCTNVPQHTRVAYHTKQAAYRTYVVAGRLESQVPEALWWDTGDPSPRGAARPYHYARIHAGSVLVGGADHKTGHGPKEDPFVSLRRWAREHFPVRRFTHAWSGQVIEPMDHLAFLGMEDDRTGVCTGDSGNGMTHGILAGIAMAQGMEGQVVGWAEAYEPSRKVPLPGLPAYARENLDVARNFVHQAAPHRSRAVAVEALAPGEGAVLEGERVAVYRDHEGQLRRMSAVCPHLGCIVAWNAVESSFDCPCHGSRFDAHGQRLNGPAMDGLAPVTPARRAGGRAGARPP